MDVFGTMVLVFTPSESLNSRACCRRNETFGFIDTHSLCRLEFMSESGRERGRRGKDIHGMECDATHQIAEKLAEDMKNEATSRPTTRSRETVKVRDDDRSDDALIVVTLVYMLGILGTAHSVFL